MSAKHDVVQLLGKLPDDCSIEDIQYHLYVMEKIRSGLDDEILNGGLSQDEAEVRLKRRLSDWFSPPARFLTSRLLPNTSLLTLLPMPELS